MPSSRNMLAQPGVAGICKYFHPRRLAGEQMSLRTKPSRNAASCTMHLMTAAILKNRILTACTNLVLMNSDLPEDLPLHSHVEVAWGCRVSRGTIPLKALVPHFYPLQLQLEKPLGLCLSPLQVQLLSDREQHSTAAPQHHQPPQPPGHSWGHTPSSGEGQPSCQICFRAFFLSHCRWILP